jgi:hypothetical protein
MRWSKGSTHPVARRVAVASMTVLAASGIGLVAAPMAFGQIVIPIGNFGNTSQGTGVTNSGSASANSGGNTAVGNASTNTATVNTDGGGLLDVPITLGAPTNTSTGEAAVTTGPATAVGNQAGTGVGQSNASGNQVNSFLNAQRQAQSAGVTNAGSASANSGGNTGVGNASQNTATVNHTGGGLLGVGVGLGGPTNTSSGEAAITSGAANATGNNSSTELRQVSSGGGAGSATRAGVGALAGIGGAGIGAGPCSTGRFASFQDVNVRNQGQAQANTGNNVAIGNASTNNAEVNSQTVSGALLAVGIQIGGPVNNSSGVAVIETGPATAIGNNSSTEVGQVQGCPQVTTLAGGGRQVVIVPAGHVVQKVGTATLARTGLDTGDLGMIAGALLGGGMLLIASQRRRAQARALAAAVPMAGFGLGLGADEWDRTVR